MYPFLLQYQKRIRNSPLKQNPLTPEEKKRNVGAVTFCVKNVGASAEFAIGGRICLSIGRSPTEQGASEHFINLFYNTLGSASQVLPVELHPSPVSSSCSRGSLNSGGFVLFQV
ncbi:hypothetical protein CDAR_48241 [Caerostris darwini]|uniref:Ribosomal protein L5 n=1 Tax=Caerostris darwini TaxID=1538125 RepID=A0AAV4W3J5_9ARAC|nr:hypothetical protein CDAR_48241 [Caerostris darwini]